MRTQRIALTVAALVAGALFTPEIAVAESGGHINLFGGVKTLDGDVWEPVDSQSEVGIEISFGPAAWPVMIALDFFHSSDEADQGALGRKGTTQEVAVGVRKIWTKGRAHPYVGGGADWIKAEVETDAPPPPAPPGLNLFPDPDPDGGTTSLDDSATGVWVGAGLFWRLGPSMNLGVAARLSGAKVSLRDDDAQAGGLHAGVLLGFGWPAASP